MDTNGTIWNGAFAPMRKNTSGCSHGVIMVDVGEPEFGFVPIYVQFNHSCPGGTAPPSNSTVYTFEVELDDFTGGQYSSAEDLKTELSNMTDSEKIKWINNNLIWNDDLTVTRSP